jgi:hypothetical protein
MLSGNCKLKAQGPHAARGPHFGHVWYRTIKNITEYSIKHRNNYIILLSSVLIKKGCPAYMKVTLDKL